MTATYTFDVFSSLDGFGGVSGGDWGGYWGKQGPELLDRRLALYDENQRMVLGANTYKLFAQMLAESTEESEVRDPWVTRMRHLPATVVSSTLDGLLDWPHATVVSGDAVDVVARPSDALSRDHRSDRRRPDLPGCGRLRPRTDREPNARRQYPRAHLPAHRACMSPSMRASRREARTACCPVMARPPTGPARRR
jgi:hypothetical protein